MGACCGGSVPPETKPINIDETPKFDTARASTIVTTNDPELQALIKQNQSQNTNISKDDKSDNDNDDENQPLNANKQEPDHYDQDKLIENAISSEIVNISSKRSQHQSVPSESMDSVITDIQTRIIHENITTNSSNIHITEKSITSDTTEKSNIEQKLAILNEDEDTNKLFPQINNLYEMKPQRSQTICNLYLLTRNDIEIWSDNISKQIESNALNHNVTKCQYNIKQCECIKRLIFILKLYNQCINHKQDINDSDLSIQHIMEYLQPYQDYQCLNDYFHFIDHHSSNISINDNNNDLIQNYFVQHCGNCDEYNCVSFMRVHRDRYKQTTEKYYNCDESEYELIAIQQILDSIHCHIFHSIMSNNNNLSVEENEKRKGHIMQKRHCNLYTIDTGIDIITEIPTTTTATESESKLIAYDDTLQQQQQFKMAELNESTPSIHSMASQLTKMLQSSSSKSTPSSTPRNKLKSHNISKLVSPKIPRQPHNSIFEPFEEQKDPNYIVSETEYLDLPYCFGHNMFYNDDDEFKLPTYSDLKKELVLNTTAPLNEYQWNIEDAKAQIIKKTYKIHPDMTLDQIVAILVYCNYNELRMGLQRSFIQKQKHKSYFHWAQLLFSVIKQFGTTDQELLSKQDIFPDIYCALNYPYKFYSFNHFNFNGLFSTTNHLSIVECSNTFIHGIILKLNSSQFGVAPFIEISTIFSDFKDESQHLFGFINGCVLQIDEIFTQYDIRNNTPSYIHKNKQFIAALQLFEQIVIDIPYIDDKKQYEWLTNSLLKAKEKQHENDEYTVIQILEYMINECLLYHQDGKRFDIPSFIQTQLGFFRHCLRESEFCKLCFDAKKIELLPRSIQKHLMREKRISYSNWCRLFPNDRIIKIKNVQQNMYESFINLFASFINEMGAKYADSLQCIDINTNIDQFDENINNMITKKNETKFKYANWTLSYESIKRQINDNHKQSYSILMSKNQIETDSASDEKEKDKEKEKEIVAPKKEDNIDDNAQYEEKEDNIINKEDIINADDVDDITEETENDENKNQENIINADDAADITQETEKEKEEKNINKEDIIDADDVDDIQETEKEKKENNINKEEIMDADDADDADDDIQETEKEENENQENIINAGDADDITEETEKEKEEEMEKQEIKHKDDICNVNDADDADDADDATKEIEIEIEIEKEKENKEQGINNDDTMNDAIKSNVSSMSNLKKEKSATTMSIKSISLLDQDEVNELVANLITIDDENKDKQSPNKETTPLSGTTGTSSPGPFGNRWGFDRTNTDGTDITDTSFKDDNVDDLKLNLNALNALNDDDLVWNGYIDKFGYEPKTPSQLQLFSKDANYKRLSFKIAKQVFNQRTGKGKASK